MHSLLAHNLGKFVTKRDSLLFFILFSCLVFVLSFTFFGLEIFLLKLGCASLILNLYFLKNLRCQKRFQTDLHCLHHNLRTPLNAISGFSYLLMQQGSKDEYAEIIYESAKSLDLELSQHLKSLE